ncbi:FAD-dependent oxidoreductase [Tahibacter harae]|uniref:FAD-dependent oxidoreductase n=1 Tax=Tahibacter harae TaxID=2963937 RepID=A0ABT1QQT4_9GAMM|nr:FAD-dependent oxidoreductase [Tahibacter harae]MCQ4164634.1 FAD-dependent oxidoreductase [Tahibacter harae]
MKHSSAIVVGAGIVGLALARALAVQGVRVVVFERHERAVGASARNPGLVLPLGVAEGPALEQARRSRAVWREFCEAADVWYDASGCLLPAWQDDEAAVMQEFAAGAHRGGEWLGPAAARERCQLLPARGLRGALWSSEEMLVDPRVALRQLPAWLADRHDVEFRWKHAVTRVEHPYVWSGGRRHAADVIYLTGGADLPALVPALSAAGAVRLQRQPAARLVNQPEGWRLPLPLGNAALLPQLAAFAGLPALPRLRERLAQEGGSGLLLLQNGSGEILALPEGESGDDAGNDSLRQRRVLDAVRGLAQLPDCRLQQTWQAAQALGAGEGAVAIADGVTAVATPGAGLGMTLAFGLAEDVVAGRCRAQVLPVPPAGARRVEAIR